MAEGYEGVFCEVNTDECSSNPCFNNGKCKDKINTFDCECPTGESGYCVGGEEEEEGGGAGGRGRKRRDEEDEEGGGR